MVKLVHQKISSIGNETGRSLEKDSGVILGGYNPEYIPPASVWRAACQEALAPRVHRHHHLCQVVRTSGWLSRNRNLPVAADHADRFVRSDVSAREVRVAFDLQSVKCLELVQS